MKKEQISLWLKEANHDRAWLAAQVGCTIGTLNQWFSKGFPDWAQKSINRLMNPLQNKASGLEFVFTHDEWTEIQQAMQLASYSKHSDFYHDAITEKAERIIENERLAVPGWMREDETPYNVPKPPPPSMVPETGLELNC